MVAAGERTEVELHDVAAPQRMFARLVVRLGRPLAERDDRLEPAVVRARCAHRELEVEGQLALVHALAQATSEHDLLERDVGGLLRAVEPRNLLGVLHPPQLLDDAPGRDELRIPDGLGQALPLAVRQAFALEPSAMDAQVPQRPREMPRALVQVDPPLEVGDLVRRLPLVTPVGEEDRGLARDDHLGVRAREAREVPDVRQPRDDERVDLEHVEALGQSPTPQAVIHASASSARW